MIKIYHVHVAIFFVDSDNDEFTLENTVTNKCLKQVRNSVWGTTCGNSLDQKWIRLKTNNEQLMNLKSLLCISRYSGVVEMSQCRYFYLRSQKLECTYQTHIGATFTTTFIKTVTDYLEQTTNGTGIFRSYTGQYWKTHQNKTEVNVCEKKTEYKGENTMLWKHSCSPASTNIFEKNAILTIDAKVLRNRSQCLSIHAKTTITSFKSTSPPTCFMLNLLIHYRLLSPFWWEFHEIFEI